MQEKGKWFTCTPKRFLGGEAFFARDSGLLCKGFQELGIKCKAILPSPSVEGEIKEDLIRTEYQNLEDPEWWRSLGAEGVVLYAWGSGQYWKVARAIKQADCKLVTHMDTAGMLGVLNGFSCFLRNTKLVNKAIYGGGMKSQVRTIIRLAYSSSIGLIRNDIPRAKHLKQADWIGAISPLALQRIQKVCSKYGGAALSDKVVLIPHPSASYMKYDPAIPKERLAIAIGRWDDSIIKGTALLMSTSEKAVSQDPALHIEIYGKITPVMHDWHERLDVDLSSRIHLKGVVPNPEITLALQRASVSLCTSLTEGYHTVSAEALCCGCSVVGPDVEEIPSMKWYTSGPHGMMARRKAASLAGAIIEELHAWDSGKRNPEETSQKWTSILHAPQVARQILNLCDQIP
jgi:glycosyltransferase involved in cell wall biosynthesis